MKCSPVSCLFVTAVCLLCMLSGCDEQILYHSYLPTPQQGWEKHDTLVFHTDTVRESAKYRFDVELRSTERCPYQSIWLIVERDFCHTTHHRCDTVECRLLDPETQRMGQGIHTYQYTVPLPPLYLDKGQAGEIRIRHYMHRETISGLRDIGIRIMR